jgi:hypothetical protein
MASYNYTFVSGDTVTPTKLNSARTVSEIVNADVSATAAIAGTKVAPAFGAQDITVSTANRSITNTTNHALSFGTNNTERMRINASGNVSVATTADTFRLHAYHATADCVVTSQGRASSLGGSGKASVQLDVDGTGGFALQTDSTSGTRLFRLISNSGYGLGETTALAVMSGGNVGIGTTSPFTVLSTAKTITGGNPATSGSTDDNVIARFAGGVVAFDIGGTAGGAQWIQPRAFNNFATNYNLLICPNGGSLAVGTTSPSAAAKLDVASTTQGFLPPRMTTAQRDAISTPPAGLVIYNTSTNVLNFYNGSAWGAV